MTEPTGQTMSYTPKSIVTVTVPLDRINTKFDRYWKAIKDRLNPDLVNKATKGGYRELKLARVVKIAGGDATFYRPVLLECVKEWAISANKSIILYENFNVSYKDDAATITGEVYYEPDVKWAVSDDLIPGIKDKLALSIQIKSNKEKATETIIAAERARLTDRHSSLLKADRPLELGMVALLDVATTIVVDGKSEQIQALTATNQRWLVAEGEIAEKEILKNIVGMKVGETKEFKNVLSVESEFKGKEVDITVSIKELFDRKLPSMAEIAAIYKMTEPDLDEEIAENAQAMVEKEYDDLVVSQAINAIGSQVAGIDMPPHAWLANRAQGVYDEQRNQVETEEDLLAKFGKVTGSKNALTKQELLGYFAMIIHKNFNTDLVLKSWGLKAGLTMPDAKPLTVESLPEFVQVVTKHILDTAVVTEVTNA